MKLFPHQQEALNVTEGQNRVAVKGFEGLYEVDTQGNVFSVDRIIHDVKCDRLFRGKMLKPTEHNGKQPYFYVSLCKNGKSTKQMVHRLVAEAFIPNPLNLPQVNHKDGNVHNNAVWNLEWATNADNTFHAYENRLKKKNVIWIECGCEGHSLRTWCALLDLDYKKTYTRYKYLHWDINKCFDAEGGVFRVADKVV